MYGDCKSGMGVATKSVEDVVSRLRIARSETEDSQGSIYGESILVN